jgi:hypothetical protein
MPILQLLHLCPIINNEDDESNEDGYDIHFDVVTSLGGLM